MPTDEMARRHEPQARIAFTARCISTLSEPSKESGQKIADYSSLAYD